MFIHMHTIPFNYVPKLQHVQVYACYPFLSHFQFTASKVYANYPFLLHRNLHQVQVYAYMHISLSQIPCINNMP